MGLTNTQDVIADLEPNRIKRNNKSLNDFIDTLKRNMNPFDETLEKDCLYNIATGRAAKDATASFLLNFEETGNTRREKFIEATSENPTLFYKSVKRIAILNFEAETEKKKKKIGGKVQEVRIQRDLFARLLAMSTERDIDIEKVKTYPITEVPLALCHLDGKIRKSDKAVLLRTLEKKIQTPNPPQFNTIIVDGFFMLRLLSNIPSTSGALSIQIMQKLISYNAERLDLVFDQYFVPSIKGNERISRDGFRSSSYNITGPNQVKPADFLKELKNSSFKEALVKFLISHWTSDELIPVIGHRRIYLNHEKCYHYYVQYSNSGNKVICEIDENLDCSSHEEADTKMVFHVTKDSSEKILIRCSDTDVLIILLGNMEHTCKSSEIWMLVGTGTNARYINVNELYKFLGHRLSSALPGVHAFTGCDYNPSFYNKGKSTPIVLLEESEEYRKAFTDLGNWHSDREWKKIFSTVEKFVCVWYNKKKCTEINKARYDEFLKNYNVNTDREKFKKKVKNLDGSSLPPCQSELYQQFLRAKYITSIWRNAYRDVPTTLKPEDNGWIRFDERSEFKWFEGEQLPNLVSDIIIHPHEVHDTDSDSVTDIIFHPHEIHEADSDLGTY